MESDILKEFLNYIDFLRELGYFISLSGFSDRFEPYTSKLLNYEIHLHGICFYLKQNPSTLGKCSLNKRNLNNTTINEPYYSCCYAGVEEYVIPVFYQDECVMRINVSGYRDKLEKSKKFALRISKSCNKNFNRLYNELSTSVPTLEEITRFISPLKYIVLELYKHCQSIDGSFKEISPTKQIFMEAQRYINENYMQQISCDSISSKFNYSTSYMQYIFKKEGNTTIKSYINNVRLNQAEYLLLHSQSNITSIALSCGFLDSNYFSTAFKNKYGISPKKYRDMHPKG